MLPDLLQAEADRRTNEGGAVHERLDISAFTSNAPLPCICWVKNSVISKVHNWAIAPRSLLLGDGAVYANYRSDCERVKFTQSESRNAIYSILTEADVRWEVGEEVNVTQHNPKARDHSNSVQGLQLTAGSFRLSEQDLGVRQSGESNHGPLEAPCK